jgi:hypothetical protein
MKILSLAVASLLSLVASSTCLAQSRWYLVASSDVATLRVDTTTIDRRADGKFGAWLQMEYSAPQSLGYSSTPLEKSLKKQYVKSLSWLVFDCEGNRFKDLRGAYYDRSGSAVRSYEHTEEYQSWTAPMPETWGEAFMSLCNSKKAILDGTFNLALKRWSDSIDVATKYLKGRCDAATGDTKVICNRYYQRRQGLSQASKAERESFMAAWDSLNVLFAISYPEFPKAP